MTISAQQFRSAWKPLLITGSIAFLYSMVLVKLGSDWWNDDNYSHGLLVPFVAAYIVWTGRAQLFPRGAKPESILGLALIVAAAVLLLGGTLTAVLFAQRLSLMVMLAGVVVYFYGTVVLKRLLVPYLLVLLAIPIPQLLFNKIAFPLQLLASRIADAGIAALGIPVSRFGNVIEITSRTTGDIVSLEVVEACSGIRSLMTLITLALIFGYFTRERRERYESGILGWLADRDVQRTVLLMFAAVPVALFTNASRVAGTGVIAYHFGRESVEGIWHDMSGSLVFLVALALLVGVNGILRKLLQSIPATTHHAFDRSASRGRSTVSNRKTLALFGAIVLCGVVVNWFQYRGEVLPDRKALSQMPARLGGWEQRNEDIRFDPESEKVLRASDYVMRDYYGPGKRLNLYVGYYASQRSGTTYHSPLSCLPGTGWVMSEPELLDVSTPAGRNLTVNRYIVQQGEHKEYLIYWYQGRGRAFASEYWDKAYTSFDSLNKRRSDGGMVRIMTPVGKDAERSLAAAVDLTGHVADNIGEFLPD